MFGNFDSTKGSIEADEFLSKCTKHFLNLGAAPLPLLLLLLHRLLRPHTLTLRSIQFFFAFFSPHCPLY
jgi:hypothetical protein